jgi:hypothetical protein
MDDTATYVDTLKKRLRALGESSGRQRQQVRQLLESIGEKEEQIEHITSLLRAEGVDLGDEGLPDLSPVSVSDMAYEVLSRLDSPEPQHYRQLAKLIMAEGKLIPGQDPAANLIAHLGRDDRFVRTGRGMYGLAEWGVKPAKKRGTGRRPRRRKG